MTCQLVRDVDVFFLLSHFVEENMKQFFDDLFLMMKKLMTLLIDKLSTIVSSNDLDCAFISIFNMFEKIREGRANKSFVSQ